MARPHAAAIIEDAWHRQLHGALRGRGWTARAIAHTGYGSASFVRVLGRVVLSRQPLEDDDPADVLVPDEVRTATGGSGPSGVSGGEEGSSGPLRMEPEVRGWRAFVTAQAMNSPVEVVVAGRRYETRTDRSGYVDLVVENHGLEPGWHTVTIRPEGGHPVEAPVQIVDPAIRFGVVSDIDDTVITTSLPRPLIAAWNTFVLHEQARHIVPGMAPMYRSLLEENPGAPLFYLSTGAWNTVGTLTRFLRRHGYPAGPLLLTDWGPTNTGWFRSGQEHKRENLLRLAREFPKIRWVLVGDDGQHDPKLYGDFARDRPDVVRAIGIRELSAAEQVLSHGIPVSNDELMPRVHQEVPLVRAPDGYGLLPQLQAILRRS